MSNHHADAGPEAKTCGLYRTWQKYRREGQQNMGGKYIAKMAASWVPGA